MIRIYTLAACAAIAGLLATTWWYTTGRGGPDVFAACRSSAIAGGSGAIGGPFTLVNGSGETVTETQVITKPSLIYFGYTFCPDVCPLDVARNAIAIDILSEQGIAAQPVFISIDPKRDTPQVVGEYARAMHEDMIGLTGTPEQVKAASQTYKTYYRAQDAEEGDDFYLVDHSTFTYLVLPDYGFVEFFRRDDTPEQIAERSACFINAA